MSIVTIITCDCGCKKKLELGDKRVAGAETLLDVCDAFRRHYFFMNVDCLKRWLETYEEASEDLSLSDDDEEGLNDALPGVQN